MTMHTHAPARKLKRWMVCAVVAGISTFAVPAAAQASPVAQASASCQGARYTSNQLGELAVFKSLRPTQGMNCASARYVMNKWLRRSYRNSYSHRLPTRFYDGYVSWFCDKTSYLRWRCDEFDSNTAFRFTAYRL
jgi:hypothetical protein